MSDGKKTWTMSDLRRLLSHLSEDCIITLPGDDLVRATIDYLNDGTMFCQLEGRKKPPERT